MDSALLILTVIAASAIGAIIGNWIYSALTNWAETRRVDRELSRLEASYRHMSPNHPSVRALHPDDPRRRISGQE